MRVLVAPDSFGGTLTAVEAAAAIAAGWRRQAPADELRLAPMSDGGPGFVAVLHSCLDGEHVEVSARNQFGEMVRAAVLVVGDTAYVESAQACGLHLSARRDPERASSYGVGQLISAAVQAGARRVVVGLGGSGTNDAGAGALAALGASATPSGALTGGPRALDRLERVDLSGARTTLSQVDLVIASDVENPLLGLRGATNVYGPQKGVTEEKKQQIDAQLAKFAEATDRSLADARGAGAAGGLGFGLLLAGGSRVGGFEVVARAVGLRALAGEADLVVTGEGSFDFSSRSGKVPYGVAAVAAEVIRPCVVLAGRVLVGAREMRALGVESAYAMVDLVGEQTALSAPAQSLSDLAARVARTWSR